MTVVNRMGRNFGFLKIRSAISTASSPEIRIIPIPEEESAVAMETMVSFMLSPDFGNVQILLRRKAGAVSIFPKSKDYFFKVTTTFLYGSSPSEGVVTYLSF